MTLETRKGMTMQRIVTSVTFPETLPQPMVNRVRLCL